MFGRFNTNSSSSLSFTRWVAKYIWCWHLMHPPPYPPIHCLHPNICTADQFSTIVVCCSPRNVRRCHRQRRQKIIVAPKINDNVYLVYNTPNATVYYIYRTHVVLDILCFLVFLVNFCSSRFWIGSKVFVLTVRKCDFWTPPPWRALRAVLQTPEMRMALDETVRKVLLGDEVLEMMA